MIPTARHPLTRCCVLAVALLILLAMLSSAPAQSPADPAGPAAPRETLFSLIKKGGPVMIPLGICSILAVAISIERFLSLRRAKIIPPGFIAGLKEKLGAPDSDVHPAIEYCAATESPVGRIFRAGILNLRRGEALVEKAIEDQGANETDKLKRSLRWLGIIASISPLLGLLGTVYGMISAFETSTIVAGGKADFLARGIYEALVTTAAGLTIAIPVLVVFQYLSARIDSLVDEIDEMGVEFLEFYARERRRDS